MTPAAHRLAQAVAPVPPRVAAYLDAYEAAGVGISAGRAPQDDLTEALSHMRIGYRPFSHGEIDGFLSATLYADVLATWPSAEELASVDLPGGTAYVGSRSTIQVDGHPAGPGSTAYSDVCARVSAALRAPGFVRPLFTRFAETVEANLAALPPGGTQTPGFRLYLCQDAGGGDALGAHLDALRKLLTIVVYLDLVGDTGPESHRHWGTSLYDSTPGEITPVTFTPNADHSRVGHVAFAANRAFVMPNNDRALHGVAGGEPGITRRSLMCGYWLFGEN